MIQVCKWDAHILNLKSTYLITLYYLINSLTSNDSEQLTILGFYSLNYQWPISTNDYQWLSYCTASWMKELYDYALGRMEYSI